MPFDPSAPQTKACCRCEGVLPRDCFSRDLSKPDGRYPRCKACTGTVVVKVTRWKGCRCGKLFSPRFGSRGDLTKTCSRKCGKLWGDKNPAWTPNPTYQAVHLRLAKNAKPPNCQVCGANRKLQWALNHERCANPVASEVGPFSTDPSHYDALCVPCHKRYDLSRIKQEAA